MKLNTENNPMLRNFLGKAKNIDGEEFTVKIMVFEKPIVETSFHGPIHSGIFAELKSGENVYTKLFNDQFTDEEMHKIGDEMVHQIDKYLAEGGKYKNTKNQ